VRTLVWSYTFVRAYKRILRRQPELPARIEQTLKALIQDPFHPQLHSHKLKGDLGGTWACTVSYDLRILFEFIQNQESGIEEILLLTIGTHEDVY